jgi:hypothetical protein
MRWVNIWWAANVRPLDRMSVRPTVSKIQRAIAFASSSAFRSSGPTL